MIADFNRDGALDLAEADALDDGVQVLLGNGDGTFQASIAWGGAIDAWAVAAGDVNGDGAVDLVVAESDTSDVRVLLGYGDGTFVPGSRTPVGASPGAVAVADLNGDGRLDAVTVNVSNVSVLLGTGHGTFRPASTIGAGNPRGIGIEDFNADGIPDLVIGDQNGNTNMFRGAGDGTFVETLAYAWGQIVSGPTVGDFNGDGAPDMAVWAGGIGILLNNGDGTFHVGTPIPLYTYHATGGTVTADFDGDGNLDLVRGDGRVRDVVMYLGNGDGSFRETRPFHSAGAYGEAPAAVGDLDCDGRPDLVTATEEVTVLLNSGCEPVVVERDAGADAGDAGHRARDAGGDTGVEAGDTGAGG